MASGADFGLSSGGSGNDGRPESIALFLNGQRGLSIADHLAEAGHRVTGCFLHGSAVTSKERLRILFPDAEVTKVDGANWHSVAQALTKAKTQVGILAGFSFLIPADILLLPPLGFLNLHAGRVPQYRGGSPLNWQLIEGEAMLGVSVLRMTAGIDDGPIVAASSFLMPKTGTIADAHASAELLFGELLLDILENLPQALTDAESQHTDDATYWHQRSDRDGEINVWCQSAEEVCRMVRALTHPYPGAWFSRNGDKFRVFAAEDSSGEFRGAPGRIVKIGGFGPVLIVKGGSVRLQEVSCESGASPLRNGDYVD